MEERNITSLANGWFIRCFPHKTTWPCSIHATQFRMSPVC